MILGKVVSPDGNAKQCTVEAQITPRKTPGKYRGMKTNVPLLTLPCCVTHHPVTAYYGGLVCAKSSIFYVSCAWVRHSALCPPPYFIRTLRSVAPFRSLPRHQPVSFSKRVHSYSVTPSTSPAPKKAVRQSLSPCDESMLLRIARSLHRPCPLLPTGKGVSLVHYRPSHKKEPHNNLGLRLPPKFLIRPEISAEFPNSTLRFAPTFEIRERCTRYTKVSVKHTFSRIRN